MKEWIRKAIIVFFVYGIIYIVLFKFININENIEIPKDVTVITTANKSLAVGSLSMIGLSAILEIYMLVKYINKTVSPETFKTNLIKLIVGTISLIIICTLCYCIYLLTNSTRFY